MFEAYITNTALYPLMGIEVGTTVHFPMTTQELQAALAKIGIDGKRYSEVFFTSFDSDVLGLYDYPSAVRPVQLSVTRCPFSRKGADVWTLSSTQSLNG